MSLYGEEPWFVAQVTPRHEKKVSAILEYKGYEHFLPTYKTRRTWSDRTKILELPVFPGYVFYRSKQALAQSVLSSPGIIRVVSFGGRPCPIPTGEIAALQCIIHSKRAVFSYPYLNEGTKVKVVAGPLSGITGIIVQLKKRSRLVLSVDLIMKSASVEVDQSEVAPLSSRAAGFLPESISTAANVERSVTGAQRFSFRVKSSIGQEDFPGNLS